MSNLSLMGKIFWATVGLIFFSYFLKNFFFYDEYRTLHFTKTQCVILDKKMNQEQVMDSNNKKQTMYEPLFLVSYTVNNKAYQDWTLFIKNGYAAFQSINEHILNQYEIGKSYQCWYDPEKPSVAILKKIEWYFLPFYLFLVFMCCYIAFNVMRLIFRIIAGLIGTLR